MIVQGQLVVRAVDYLSAPYGMMDPYEEIRKAADRSRQVHSTIGHLVQQAVVGSSRLGVENGENIVPQLCNWAAAQGKKRIQIFAEHRLCRRFTQKPTFRRGAKIQNLVSEIGRAACRERVCK